VDTARTITSIEVDALFGLFSYKIPLGQKRPVGQAGHLILYGDNGTGKTTILQLVYHLLDKRDDRGHRSYLARVPFRRLSVSLSDGTKVIARRAGKEQKGAYSLDVTRADERICHVEAIVDRELRIRTSQWKPEEQRRWQDFLDALSALDVSFFFLADDRKTRDPQDEEIMPEGQELSGHDFSLAFRRSLMLRERDGEDKRLNEAVEGLEKWIKDELLRSANVGEASTNTVYADIARRIVRRKGSGRTTKVSPAEILRTLHELERRSNSYVDLGLVQTPRLEEIVAALQSPNASARRLIADVISPYIDGLSARLDALEEVQVLLTLFLDRINGFYTNKRVTYDVTQGFQITSANGERLRTSQLSSGERQLLLLLAKVLTARREATIFLIDEPEISLNVKWQRKLVDTLLDLVRGTSVQFILATHSLELLATHRQFVHRLTTEFERGAD